MNKLVGLTGLVVLVMGVVVVMFPHEASAQIQACYAWDIFPLSPIRINVRSSAPLTLPGEPRPVPDIPVQRSYPVDGKAVNPCVFGTMATVTGTIVTGSTFGPTVGTHLGLKVHLVRPGCFEYTLDCTSAETSPAPTFFVCFSRSLVADHNGGAFSTLTLVNPFLFPLCGLFQDGLFAPAEGFDAPIEPDTPFPGAAAKG